MIIQVKIKVENISPIPNPPGFLGAEVVLIPKGIPVMKAHHSPYVIITPWVDRVEVMVNIDRVPIKFFSMNRFHVSPPAPS